MKSWEKYERTNEPERTLSILLAEDDLEMRKLLSWSLERKGYKVIECPDGTTLMRKLGLLGPLTSTQTHDLIISDIRMPGATGLQVLECAREFDDFPPMILITAFPDSASREQALRLGAVAMLAKPFDIQELLEKVRETIPPRMERRDTLGVWPDTETAPHFPFDITFRHGSGSEAAKEYVRGTAAKLRRFADHIVNGKIIIDQSDAAKPKKHRYMLTLVLSTTGKPIVVKHDTDVDASDENLYMAVNVAFGIASRELKQYINKRRSLKKRGSKKNRFPEKSRIYDEDEPDTDTK